MEIDEEFVASLRFYTQEEVAEQNIGWEKISVHSEGDRENINKYKEFDDFQKFSPKYKFILAPSPTIPEDEQKNEVGVGGNEDFKRDEKKEEVKDYEWADNYY